jgi:hypothetical protein
VEESKQINMEELIRLKIAELEENYPHQALEHRLINDIILQDNEIQFDESEICRPFDSEVFETDEFIRISFACSQHPSQVIDERKALDERIRNVRDLYIQEIRVAQALETESLELFQQSKIHMNNLVQLNTEQMKKKRELKVQEELKNKLHEMCRLLQKQAKEIVEDSERQRELEQVRMTDLTNSFTETINGISKKIIEQEELFVKQADENNQLRSKLNEFQEHTKLRDSHFKSQLHAKDLELQLIEARRTQEVFSFRSLTLPFSYPILSFRDNC